MSRSWLEYLRHILDETAFVASQVEGLSREAFLQDETLKRAVVRSLEIIGEAAKKLPAEARQTYPEVDWRAQWQGCVTVLFTMTLGWTTKLYGTLQLQNSLSYRVKSSVSCNKQIG